MFGYQPHREGVSHLEGGDADGVLFGVADAAEGDDVRVILATASARGDVSGIAWGCSTAHGAGQGTAERSLGAELLSSESG